MTADINVNPLTTKQAARTWVEHREDFISYLMERVEVKHMVEGAGECWVWKQATNSGGYPKGRWGHKEPYLVHRKVAVFLNEDDVTGKTVHHKCAVRRCVNPAHLETITQRENNGEMFARKFYEGHIENLRTLVAKSLSHLPKPQQEEAMRLLAVSV